MEDKSVPMFIRLKQKKRITVLQQVCQFQHTISNILLVTYNSWQTSFGLLEDGTFNGVLKARQRMTIFNKWVYTCVEKSIALNTCTYTSVRFWSLYISRDWNSLSTPMSRIFCWRLNAPSQSFIHTIQPHCVWKNDHVITSFVYKYQVNYSLSYTLPLITAAQQYSKRHHWQRKQDQSDKDK